MSARKFVPPRIHRGALSGRIYCVTHGKVLKIEDGQEYIEASIKYDVTTQVEALITDYERTVTTTRLRELLAERGPGEVIPTSVVEERQVDRPCVNCGQSIEPGRLYVVDGPQHIKCDTEDEAGC